MERPETGSWQGQIVGTYGRCLCPDPLCMSNKSSQTSLSEKRLLVHFSETSGVGFRSCLIQGLKCCQQGPFYLLRYVGFILRAFLSNNSSLNTLPIQKKD